jgi:hypothetical protein
MKRYFALLADMEGAGYLNEDLDGDWVQYAEHERELARHKGAVEDWARMWERSDEEVKALRTELAAGNAAIRDACKLFMHMATEDRHDHIAPETWKAVCEWQGRPEVVAAHTRALLGKQR